MIFYQIPNTIKNIDIKKKNIKSNYQKFKSYDEYQINPESKTFET